MPTDDTHSVLPPYGSPSFTHHDPSSPRLSVPSQIDNTASLSYVQHLPHAIASFPFHSGISSFPAAKVCGSDRTASTGSADPEPQYHFPTHPRLFSAAPEPDCSPAYVPNFTNETRSLPLHINPRSIFMAQFEPSRHASPSSRPVFQVHASPSTPPRPGINHYLASDLPSKHQVVENELVWSRVKGSEKEADAESVFSVDADGETDDESLSVQEGGTEGAVTEYLRALPPSAAEVAPFLTSTSIPVSTLPLEVIDQDEPSPHPIVSIDDECEKSISSPISSFCATPNITSPDDATTFPPRSPSCHITSPTVTDSKTKDTSPILRTSQQRFSDLDSDVRTECEAETELFSEDEFGYLHSAGLCDPRELDEVHSDSTPPSSEPRISDVHQTRQRIASSPRKNDKTIPRTAHLSCYLLTGLPRRGPNLSHLEKVFHMIHIGKYTRWIDWNKAGDALIIPDEVAFGNYVMPDYFGTNQWDSFKRQLTTYHFSRRTTTDPLHPKLRGHIISHPQLRRKNKAIWKLVTELPDPQARRPTSSVSFSNTTKRTRYHTSSEEEDADTPLALKQERRALQQPAIRRSTVASSSDNTLGTRSWKKTRTSDSTEPVLRAMKVNPGKGKTTALRPHGQ